MHVAVSNSPRAILVSPFHTLSWRFIIQRFYVIARQPAPKLLRCAHCLSGEGLIPSADRLWHSYRGQRLKCSSLFWDPERVHMSRARSMATLCALHCTLVVCVHSSCSRRHCAPAGITAVFSLAASRPILSSKSGI